MKSKLLLLVIVFNISINHLLIGQNPTIGISPGEITIIAGQSAEFYISVINSGDFTQQLFFDISFTTLPLSDFSYIFEPDILNYPYSDSISLKINTNGNIPPGKYLLVINGNNGPVSALDTCNLNISLPECKWIKSKFPSYYYPGYFLTIDKIGNKWISGLTSLIKFDGINWYEFNSNNSNFPHGGFGVGKVAVDTDNNIWIPVRNKGLVKYDGIYWTVYDTSSSDIPSNAIEAILIDSLNNKWIATNDAGLVKYDGNNWTLFNSSNTPLNYNSIRKLTIDRYGDFWMAVYPGSSSDYATCIAKFDGSVWQFYNNDNACFTFSCINSNLVFDIENNLWFTAGNPYSCPGTSTGLIKFNGSFWEVWQNSSIFQNHYIKNTDGDIIVQDNASQLPSSYCRELFIDSLNNIWIATLDDLAGAGNGLIRFNDSIWQNYSNTNSGIGGNAIRGIDINKGEVWIISSPDFYNSTTPNYLTRYTCDTLFNYQAVFQHSTKGYIYPNPTTGKIIIREKNVNEINVYNLSGIKILNYHEGSEIDLSNLKNGIYIVVVVTDKDTLVNKVLKY
jgi:membrane protein implicated in regulation of membrane protease activity